MLCSYAIITSCWYSDPQERTIFANLTEQLSNLLEKESGYLHLGLRHSLRWKTHGKSEKKDFPAKTPIHELDEVEINGTENEV